MFKPLNIIFSLLFCFCAFTSYAQDNFSIFVPEFIPREANFEVSLITSKNFPDAEKLDIYFFPDISLLINEVELRTSKGNYKVPLRSDYLQNFPEVSQRANIDLTDTSIFSPDYFFQIVIYLRSQNVSLNHLQFYSEYVSGNDVVGHLYSSDEKLITEKPDLYQISINYFEKYNTAENAARFNQNNYLNIPLDYKFNDKLIAEFWLKQKNFYSTFLEIINWETNRVEYNLSMNENQMLALNSRLKEDIQLAPFFISSNCWYHFVVVFDRTNSQLSFLCNDLELANFQANNSFNFDNLLIHFKKNILNGSFSIEQFRLVSDSGSLAAIIRNGNYSSYSDDSSSVLLQINFSESELENLLNQKSISYEGITLLKSNAPIFPRAPELNLKILNNFFEADWNGGDFINANYYVLERAVGNSGFEEVGREAADNSKEKNYSLLTEKPSQSEIIYFRLKQVNKDGTLIYSDVVKVGQGEIDDVILGQNYPNPFNPTTTIKFELLQDTDVEIKVFDLEGKEVALLYKGFLNRGFHQMEFNAEGLSSGIYIYQIETPLTNKSHKMIFAK